MNPIPLTLRQELDALDGHGLIRQAKPLPELEYMFKHALVQEAAYESLLKAARGDLHRRVAEAIEGSLDADAAILAMHYAQAGVLDKALSYSAQAGNAAKIVYANREALMHYAAALDVAERMGAKDTRTSGLVAEVYVNRGRVLEVLGRPIEAIENYRAMLAAARATGDRAAQADAMNRLNRTHVVYQGPLAVAEGDLTDALALARETGDAALMGYALHNLGLRFRFIEPLRAADYFQQAYDSTQVGAQAGAEQVAALRELEANSLVDSMIAMMIGGYFRRALDYGRRALAAYRALDNKPMIADALGGMALILYWQGRPGEARELNDEGIRISTAIDNPWGLTYHEWRRYETELDRGNGEACIERLEERRAIAAQIGFPVFAGQVMHQAARAYLQRGEIERAIALDDAAGDAFESVQVTSWKVWGRGVRALPHLRAGDVAHARSQLETLWRPGESHDNARQGFLMAGPVMAEWALADNRITYGLALCDWLLDWLEAEGAHRIAGEVRYWRARLRLANGDAVGARADLLQARDWLVPCEAWVLVKRIDEALAQVG